ncbi:MAG: hypothetical protein O3B84_07675 [Chloroflexi bacterium]|nr:hypothetical protein [Chloroflexota bacterium]
MPKFLDHHVGGPAPSAEVVKGVIAAIKAGKADPFGVKPLNTIQGSGESWCLTEAPNADAVIKSHGAMGIPQTKERIFEVQTAV